VNILVYSPRPRLQRIVGTALRAAQFIVEDVGSANECFEYADFREYSGFLVDPDPQAFADTAALIKKLRQKQRNTAIFVLAKNLTLENRLLLLDAGIDYCVDEPFWASELIVRLNNTIRLRMAGAAFANHCPSTLRRYGDLEMDAVHLTVTRAGIPLTLLRREFLILEFLLSHVNRTVTREMILENALHLPLEGSTNIVEVYISALRKKVDHNFSQKLIVTNRGVGYSIVCNKNLPD
jgi:DNA-binding response OmpR family regulator